jgi:transcriptional regulator with XRE-family HTH domain
MGANSSLEIQSERSKQQMSSVDERQSDRETGSSFRVREDEGKARSGLINAFCNIKDVARLAGLSIATVSHVTNGSVNVPSKTTARVLAASSQLQYYPNALVTELAHGKSDRPRMRSFIDLQPLAWMQRSPRMQASKQEANAAPQSDYVYYGTSAREQSAGGVKQSERLEDLRIMIG